MDEILTLEQWNELESRIRQLYPELTDDDLQYHEAVELDMIKMVEYSLRKANEGMQGFIDRHFGVSNLKFNWRRGRNSTYRIRQRI
jgi:hypothetical protein